MILFIDTSYYLNLGLLDEAKGFVEYLHRPELQHSAEIHSLIDELLRKHGASFKTLKGVMVCNGPGSYTGIRLAEGMAQIFELENLPVYSFHHYQVPSMLEIKSGAWVCHAFKKEIYVYKWDGDKNENYLIKEEDWKNPALQIFSHQDGPWGEGYTSTGDLIKTNGEKLWKTLKASKQRVDPYYFRPLELEFRRSVE